MNDLPRQDKDGWPPAKPISAIDPDRNQAPVECPGNAWNDPACTCLEYLIKPVIDAMDDHLAHNCGDPVCPCHLEEDQSHLPAGAWDQTVTPTSGGVKFDVGKPRLGLIPKEALYMTGEVLGYGATKYEAWNWAKGMSWERLCDAALRHIYQFLDGHDLDDEPDGSGLNHIGHALCMLSFLAWHYEHRKDMDDRRTTVMKEPK